MNIDGLIQIYDGNKLISTGTNLITNAGRDLIIDWFLHDSYTNCGEDVYRGTSFSSERFLMQNEYTMSNAALKQFWDTSTYNYISNNSTITLQINNEPIRLSGLYINWRSRNIDADGQHQYIQRMQIFTSADTITDADINNSWQFRKIATSVRYSNFNGQYSRMIRFDNANSVDGYIDNVKSIKILFNNYSNSDSYYSILYGIGLLKKTPYKNIPCVIGLGSSNIQPTVQDIELNDQKCKLFVNNQYATIQEDLPSDSSNSNSSLINLNETFKSTLLDRNIKKVNIVYFARLSYAQYNNIDFNQIGLFYSDNQVDYISGANTCNKLFSHGLTTTWNKNNKQIIDIKYTIAITV